MQTVGEKKVLGCITHKHTRIEMTDSREKFLLERSECSRYWWNRTHIHIPIHRICTEHWHPLQRATRICSCAQDESEFSGLNFWKRNRANEVHTISKMEWTKQIPTNGQKWKKYCTMFSFVFMNVFDCVCEFHDACHIINSITFSYSSTNVGLICPIFQYFSRIYVWNSLSVVFVDLYGADTLFINSYHKICRIGEPIIHRFVVVSRCHCNYDKICRNIKIPARKDEFYTT